MFPKLLTVRSPRLRGLFLTSVKVLNILLMGLSLETDARGTVPTERYRIGDVWGPRNLTKMELQLVAAKATVSFNRGTGIYLGKLNGRHFLMTNLHVCPTKCDKINVRFEAIGVIGKSAGKKAGWKEIDLALVEFQIPEKDEAELKSIRIQFDFEIPKFGDRVLALGYGTAGNPRLNLRLNQDGDCRIVSDTGDFRLSADPDRLENLQQLTWSMVHGCDLSHGDSGSGLFRADNGKLIGINWTGRYPVKSSFKKTEGINSKLQDDPQSVWSNLPLTVPVLKIHEVLSEKLPSSDSHENALISAFLDRLRE